MNTMILTEVNCMFPFCSGLSLSSTSSSFSKLLRRSNRSFRLIVPLEILSFVKLMFIFPDLNNIHVYIFSNNVRRWTTTVCTRKYWHKLTIRFETPSYIFFCAWYFKTNILMTNGDWDRCLYPDLVWTWTSDPTNVERMHFSCLTRPANKLESKLMFYYLGAQIYLCLCS